MDKSLIEIGFKPYTHGATGVHVWIDGIEIRNIYEIEQCISLETNSSVKDGKLRFKAFPEFEWKHGCGFILNFEMVEVADD